MVIDFDLKLKFFLISTIIMLLVNFGNSYSHDSVLQNSVLGIDNSSSEGAYPVIWCDYIDEGDNLNYQITSVVPNEGAIFETGGLLVCILGDIVDQVDNGYYANLDSDFYYNGVNISKNLVPPILVPEKVFRACCSAYKPLTVQLEDWGWENFSLIEEGEDFLRLRFLNDLLDANITFNTDGLALNYDAKLTNFIYSVELTTEFPHDSSMISSIVIKWDFTLIAVPFTVILLIKRRKKSHG